VRELREELGVEAVVGATLRTTRHRYPDGRHVEIAFAQVSSIDRAPTNIVFAALRWVPIPELGSVDFLDGDHAFVRDLVDGRIRPAETLQGAQHRDGRE
jgi:8-oxo-dGTP pyrophosphatase MutT (NUDIX family)